MEVKAIFIDGKVHVSTSEKAHPFLVIGILEVAKQTVIMNGSKPAEVIEETPETKE